MIIKVRLEKPETWRKKPSRWPMNWRAGSENVFRSEPWGQEGPEGAYAWPFWFAAPP